MLFTFTMVLLVIPCAVAYFVELSWKLGYIKSKRLRLAQQWDSMFFSDPGSAHAAFLLLYLVYLVISIVWLACHAAVSVLPAIACEGGGR